MPTITVQLLSGRTDYQKRALERAIVSAVVETLSVDAANVKVRLAEISPDADHILYSVTQAIGRAHV